MLIFSNLPHEVIIYLLLFDKRFIYRNNELLTINKLNKNESIFNLLEKKPLIIKNKSNTNNHDYTVEFTNKKYKLFFDYIYEDDDVIYRIIFEKMEERYMYWCCYFL